MKMTGLMTKIILCIGVLACGTLTIASLIIQSSIAMDSSEISTFIHHDLAFVILLLLFFIVLIAFGFLSNYMIPYKLFIALTILYLIAGSGLLLGMHTQFRFDPKFVYDAALAMNNGDYASLDLLRGGYLAIYPHQLGIATFERFILLFSQNQYIFFFLNLLMVIGINFFLWQLTSIFCRQNKCICNLTILLSFGFLPQFFFILFFYGLTLGLFALLIGLYLLTLGFVTTKNRWQPSPRMRFIFKCFGSLFVVLSALLRNNYQIAVIAVCCVLLLQMLKTRSAKPLLWVLVIIIGMSGSGRLLTAYYEQVSGYTLGSGAPKILWVTMGLQDSTGSRRLGGWYNGYNLHTYRDTGYDADQAAKIAAEDLQVRLDEMAANPADTTRFFREKFISTWCEPSFQSLWFGALKDCGQYSDVPLLDSLYTSNTTASDVLSDYEDCFLIALYLLSLLYVLRALLYATHRMHSKREEHVFLLFPCIYLIGGILFHLVWETKSQYVYPYVFMLIPYAGCMIEVISDKIYEKRSERSGKH